MPSMVKQNRILLKKYSHLWWPCCPFGDAQSQAHMAVLLSGAWAKHQCAAGMRASGAGMQEPAELGLEDGPRDARKGSVLSAG